MKHGGKRRVKRGIKPDEKQCRDRSPFGQSVFVEYFGTRCIEQYKYEHEAETLHLACGD